MKKFLIKVLILAVALFVGLAVVKYFSPEKVSAPSFMSKSVNNSDGNFPEKIERRKTFFLDTGEPIIVSKINGAVEIEYADVSETEVKVTRSVNNREDFDYRYLVMAESGGKLNVRMKNARSIWALFGTFADERQTVLIKTPHGTQVITKCINGTVEEREVKEGGTIIIKKETYQCSQ